MPLTWIIFNQPAVIPHCWWEIRCLRVSSINMRISLRLRVLEGEDSLIKLVIPVPSMNILNCFIEKMCERKVFYVLRLLKKKSLLLQVSGLLALSLPHPIAWPFSLSFSLCPQSFIVWCASRFGLGNLLSPHNCSDDSSLIYRFSLYLSPFLSKCLMDVST